MTNLTTPSHPATHHLVAGHAIPLKAVLQYQDIRASGEANMLDKNAVQQIAHREGKHALVQLLADEKRYAALLMHFSELLAAAQAEQARQHALPDIALEPPPTDEDTQEVAPVNAAALPDLHLHAQRVHDLRQTHATMKALWQEALDAFHAQNRALIETLDELAEELTQAEAQAREAVLAHFAVTGQKSLDFGFSVAEYTVHQVDDDNAVAYCIAHNLPGALKLNRSAFFKLLNSGVVNADQLDYQTTITPKARLPKDLSKHL